MTNKFSSRKYFVTALDYGLWSSSYLQYFFPEKIKVKILPDQSSDSVRLGWGQKPSGQRARGSGRSFLLLEDGFLRSIGLGVRGAQPLSLVVDDLGIYYDATTESRLERLICEVKSSPEAAKAIELICAYHLSKYNHAPERKLPATQSQRILVIDQTRNDMSVSLGGADEKVFNDMLAAALKENPDAEIIVKTHPDVLAGNKQGYLTAVPRDSRITIYAEDISPISLLKQVDKVYVVTSQMGFEALMLKKSVVCFGLPWYAGWGLTQDRNVGISALKQRRRRSCTLEDLFTAAYIEYPRYLNPLTNKRGTIFDVIDFLIHNKALNDATRGDIYCLDMSLWKRAVVKPFLATPSSRLHFTNLMALSRKNLATDAKILIWGVQNELKVLEVARSKGVPVWRMEDGFLRSVGLGSDLFRPLSLVLDKNGMYYDPTSASDLQSLLEATGELTVQDLARAKLFRQKYRQLKISKYNLQAGAFQVNSHGKKVLLVPGQVQDDASIRRGAVNVKTNLQLLETVRQLNPQAYIIYKPHPDVEAGNREGAIAPEELSRLADVTVTETNIIDCIMACDEVHTMTSLAGFEALIHDKVVHCYGAPFYAGRGLTMDHVELPQRKRQVSVEEMLFAVILKYPRYILPGIQGFVSAEAVLDYLVEEMNHRTKAGPENGLGGWIKKKTRKVQALFQLFF